MRCEEKGGVRWCFETRTFRGQELRCEANPRAWWSNRKDMCVFPEAQVLNGVEFPWGSTAYVRETGKKERLISFVKVQSLFMTGSALRIHGFVVPHVRFVSFDDSGKVSMVDFVHDGCGRQLPDAWVACCRLYNGCAVMLRQDGAFDRCEAYELPGSD